MEEEAAKLGSGIDEGAANKRQLLAGGSLVAWRALPGSWVASTRMSLSFSARAVLHLMPPLARATLE